MVKVLPKNLGQLIGSFGRRISIEHGPGYIAANSSAGNKAIRRDKRKSK